MLPADAAFELWTGFSSFADRYFNELADARRVEVLERI